MNSRNTGTAVRTVNEDSLVTRSKDLSPTALRLWKRGAKWQQGIAIALVMAGGLELFMRAMALLTIADNGWAVCWRLNGVTAACMLRTQTRRWPWILLGFVLSQLWTGYQIHAAPGATAVSLAANLLEICIVAFLLPKFTSVDAWIREPHITARFTWFALILSPLAGALTAAAYFAHQNHEAYVQSAVFWWLGDSLGMVLWLPMILVCTTRELYALFEWNALPRTLGLLGFMMAAAGLIFFSKPQPIEFALLPILLWVGLRLGFSGSVLAVNILALVATSATLLGHGPFVLMGVDMQLRTLALQVFLMLAMLMALPVSVVLLERRVFEEQLQEAYRAMKRQATQDSLTGVANRRRFDEALQQEWQRAMREVSPIALLMVDADQFKAYNDHYGHLAGDEALRRIAQAMVSVIHRPADLVARYGGEEFSILLPGTDESGAASLAELVRQTVLEQGIPHIRSISGLMTVSIGCRAVIPVPGTTPSTLIREADAALYTAKRNGRNRVERSGRR